MRTLTKKDVKPPKRARTSHKGQHGTVLVVGGSESLVGAVALAAIAAARSGADLVHVAAPEKVAWAVNCLSPDLITHKLRGKHLSARHFQAMKKLAAKVDVVLIGNGIGRSTGTGRLVKKLLTLPNKKVIDADALRMIRARDLRDTILTPHANELKDFLRNSRIPMTTDAAKLHRALKAFVAKGNVLVLKGAEDLVLGKTVVKNTTGNPGMTRGGTGDVLAGLCAGYYAQLGDAWQAACNAAFVNGHIGDLLLKKKKGYTYLASDMLDEIRRIA